MNYINENNTYNGRRINESQSRPYNQTDYPTESISDSNDTNPQTCSTNKNQQECQCNNPNPPDNTCNNPNPIDCKPSDSWDCKATDNCCNSQTCSYDASKSRCICTYANILFDEAKAIGSTLFSTINTSTGDNYIITADYKAMDNCCNPCTVDTTSVYTVESSKVKLRSLNYTGTPGVGDILVNGSPVLSVTITGSNVVASIDPSILDSSCSNCNQGSKATILLNNFNPWSFIASYELCGKVRTNNTTCKFKINLTNQSTVPSTVTQPSTFVAQEICIPESTNNSPVLLYINFEAFSQLINPSLVPVLSIPTVPTSPVVPSLTGSIMLNTNANIEIIKNTKICFNAMVN